MTEAKKAEGRCARCAFWERSGWGFSRPCSLWHGLFREADSGCVSFQPAADRAGGRDDGDGLKAFVDAALGEGRS